MGETPDFAPFLVRAIDRRRAQVVADHTELGSPGAEDDGIGTLRVFLAESALAVVRYRGGYEQAPLAGPVVRVHVRRRCAPPQLGSGWLSGTVSVFLYLGLVHYG